MKQKHLFYVIIAIAILYFGNDTQHTPTDPIDATSSAIQLAYDNQQSNKIVIASGTVSKLLADDNKGSRHQKFIVTISSSLSILIAHNIDLAPRINNIKVGDNIEIKGEYEWNTKGGVVHWTHHDPRGNHPGGWLKHRGKVYE
jgi:hypothetical protein